MKILFLVWDSLGGLHLIKALEKAGHEVILFPFSKDLAAKRDEKYTYTITEEILKKTVDRVFTFNFFPIVAIACKACGIPYVSWVYDNPCIDLYSETIKYETNRTFLFDSQEVEKLNALGVTTVQYLPLATSPDFYKDQIEKCGDSSKYACDIAFVGATKTESDSMFKQFDQLDSYTKGYLDSLINAQKQIYGYNFIEQLLTPEIIQKLKAVYPIHLGNDYFATENWLFANYYLHQKVTGIERFEILNMLSSQHDVNLYTLEPTPFLPKVHNLGQVNYYEEAPLAFYNAKINLNITLKSITSGIPLRALDIMGAGGFLLTNYQGDFLRHFVPDQDFVFYDSYEDLLEKTEYYLSHEKERIEIAKNGYEKVCASHTYGDRICELLS